MYAAYTELKKAEKVKLYLAKHNLFNQDFLPVRELGHIYFPLRKRAKVPHAEITKPKFKFPQKPLKLTVESLLKNKLTTKQLKLLPKSQELVGTILVLEIPEELEKKEKIIAEAYLKVTHHVNTVVKKTKIHHGQFRLRGVKILAGKRTKETTHYENGIKLQLHLEKTYFSARTANERLRVSKQVKKNEQVLVMFAGCGPLPLVIAKNTEAKDIYSIELNPFAHQYALKNEELNKIHNWHIFHGDVKDILPKWKRKFNRIAMPLPKTGEEFLPIAIKRCKKGGIIHLYAFLNENDLSKEVRRINKAYSVKVLRKVKCGQFSPNVYRICFDLKVL
ncbi:class I SAM-dependent methyltransferase family protein [Candidatus Woesearchaeota archaeon]|jgi:tRNA (guanine37-N1)-methyltransferase|nr:class I SAM-dependent methyltransferase family protein [Candidatus Woesearchaeota archaeon]MBT5739787.1 class I SAM-dependent methyltransferase family protein [Candidatus Woesearchaeota archaeon]